jgi:hypothetical protein
MTGKLQRLPPRRLALRARLRDDSRYTEGGTHSPAPSVPRKAVSCLSLSQTHSALTYNGTPPVPCPPTKRQLQAWRDTGADPNSRPRTHWRLASVFDRLSRVRSGGGRRRPSREIRCLPVSRLCCSSAPASQRRGRLWPARSSRSRRPRATAQRRSRAPRRYPREQERADQMPRMPPPCPHTGNLADRRQVAEGCRLAPGAATSSDCAHVIAIVAQQASRASASGACPWAKPSTRACPRRLVLSVDYSVRRPATGRLPLGDSGSGPDASAMTEA